MISRDTTSFESRVVENQNEAVVLEVTSNRKFLLPIFSACAPKSHTTICKIFRKKSRKNRKPRKFPSRNFFLIQINKYTDDLFVYFFCSKGFHFNSKIKLKFSSIGETARTSY